MKVPPPLLALVAGLVQRALTGPTPRPARPRLATSSAVALASLAMAGTASRRFRRSGTTVNPFHPERASVLVTDGANSVSRNPMYVGMAGLLAAHALWRGAWVAWLPVVGFVTLIDRRQIRAEESALSATFGTDYEAYRSSTPRWLGRRSFDRSRVTAR